MADNHSFQHITNNFSLYGFSDPKTGCLQAVKELLDNAIDALHEAASAGQAEAGRIILLITYHDNKPNCVVLECEDNGCGMSNPEKVIYLLLLLSFLWLTSFVPMLQLLQLFSTSKVDNSSAGNFRAGRFGMGLSTSVLYSLKHTG